MRTEAHAFVGDFSQCRKAEDLVAAGIRKDGTRPGHKLMQAAELADQFMAGAQIEMVGIGEDYFRAEFFEGFLGEGFDGSLRAHGHEEGSLYWAVRRGQKPAPRASRIRFRYFKRKIHPLSLSEENPRHHGEDQNKGERRSERNSKRFPERRLLRIGGGETNRHEDDGPKREDV